MSVSDADELRCAGALPFDYAARVTAALEYRLDVHVLLLDQRGTALDDRRVGLCVFVYSPATVRVRQRKRQRVERPARHKRQRIVLLADGGSGSLVGCGGGERAG